MTDSVHEARLKKTHAGLVVESEGWFVLNARDVPWWRSEEKGQGTELEGKHEFPQLGFHLYVLLPGQHSVYHGEIGQVPCVIAAAGSRVAGFEGLYPVNEVAAKYDASALEETSNWEEAHARFGQGERSAYRDGWLPSISAPRPSKAKTYPRGDPKRCHDQLMVPEGRLAETETGLVPGGEGWFVLNTREARWFHAEGRGARVQFEGEKEFPQVGVSLFVLAPGEPIGMYHWEADQEDFLVLSGEALLIVEGEERPLRQWDFVHCPAETKHIVVGAGERPCIVLAVGAREHQGDGFSGGYPVDEVALRHRAGVERETTVVEDAYAHLPKRGPTSYAEGWLPR